MAQKPQLPEGTTITSCAPPFRHPADAGLSIFQYLQQQVETKEAQLGLAARKEVPDAALTSLQPTTGDVELGGCQSPQFTPIETYVSTAHSFAKHVDTLFHAPLSHAVATSASLFPLDTLLQSVTDQTNSPSTSFSKANAHRFPHSPAYENLSSVPIELSRHLFQEYLQHVLPKWPAFDADDLWDSFSRCYQLGPNMDECTTFDTYCVAMVLAIWTASSTALAAPKAASTSLRLYRTALRIHPFSAFPSIENIQAALLRVQYFYLMPDAGEPEHFACMAMRMAIDLDLHLQCGKRHVSLTSKSTHFLELLFWTVYAVERSVCLTLNRRLGIDDALIDLPLPPEHRVGSTLDDASDGSQSRVRQSQRSQGASPEFPSVVRLRKLQSEILCVRFLGTKLPNGLTYEVWVRDMETRISHWRGQPSDSGTGPLESGDRAARAGISEGSDGEQVSSNESPVRHTGTSQTKPGWFLVGVYQALLLLFRPSPHEPMPPEETLVKCFEIAHRYGESTFEYLRHGSLRLPWHGGHQCLQAGLVLLFAVKHSRKHLLETRGVVQILQAVQVFSSNFTLLSSDWSRILEFRALYDRLQGDVMREIMRPWEYPTTKVSASATELERLVLAQRLDSTDDTLCTSISGTNEGRSQHGDDRQGVGSEQGLHDSHTAMGGPISSANAAPQHMQHFSAAVIGTHYSEFRSLVPTLHGPQHQTPSTNVNDFPERLERAQSISVESPTTSRQNHAAWPSDMDSAIIRAAVPPSSGPSASTPTTLINIHPNPDRASAQGLPSLQPPAGSRTLNDGSTVQILEGLGGQPMSFSVGPTNGMSSAMHDHSDAPAISRQQVNPTLTTAADLVPNDAANDPDSQRLPWPPDDEAESSQCNMPLSLDLAAPAASNGLDVMGSPPYWDTSDASYDLELYSTLVGGPSSGTDSLQGYLEDYTGFAKNWWYI